MICHVCAVSISLTELLLESPTKPVAVNRLFIAALFSCFSPTLLAQGGNFCPTDFNGDGLTTSLDLLFFLGAFGSPCVYEGCTDPDYLEYNATATSDDGSCQTLMLPGCTNPDYLEYDAAANIDNGSCAMVRISGCTNEDYLEYSFLANDDDGSCATLIVLGCTYPAASNYNSEANIDDGSCVGMTDGGPGDPGDSGDGDTVQVMIPGTAVGQTLFWDGTQWALLDIGNPGESLKVGENQLPQWSPGGALSDAPTIGCDDPASCNYDPTAEIVFNELCEYETCYGCTDSLYLEFDALHTFEDSSCVTLAVPGCTDPAYLEFDPAANQYDGSCITLMVFGCTDSLYIEFNPAANVDDGSCATLVVLGCTDSLYIEFNPEANTDDGSCAGLLGCTDSAAFNYDPAAAVDNGSCIVLGGDTAFYEDFSNGFLGNSGLGEITVDDTSPDTTIWQFVDSVGDGYFQDGTASGVQPPAGEYSTTYGPINSMTASNGWVIFDADFYNTPVDEGYVDVEGHLTLPVLDFSTDTSVLVMWDQYFSYCCYNPAPLFLEVSVDGGVTWSSLEAQGDFFELANEYSANPLNTAIDITAVAAGQSAVNIRFSYLQHPDIGSGYSHYFWALDDILITTDP